MAKGRPLYPERRLLPPSVNPSDVLYVGDPRLAAMGGQSGPRGLTGAPGPQGDQGPPGIPGEPGDPAAPFYANAKVDFGAVGDGITNDTDAIQDAADEAFQVESDFSGVLIPTGRYTIGTIVLPNIQGVHLTGDGPVDYPSDSTAKGTHFTSSEPIVFDLAGCFRFVIDDISIQGDGSNIGMRLKTKTGSASGVASLHNITFLDFDQGFNAGLISDDPTGWAEQNAADLSFHRCSWGNCDTAFKAEHSQVVNIAFYDASIGHGVTCFDTSGSSASGIYAFMLATYDQERILLAGPGGPNSGACIFVGLKMDGGAHRTILYEADEDGWPFKATFIDPHFNLAQLPVAGEPRVKLKTGHVVKIIGGENFASSEGAFFSMDGGGTLLVIGALIPSDWSKVQGTMTGGQFRFRDCIDKDTRKFLPDRNELGVIASWNIASKSSTTTRTSTSTLSADPDLTFPMEANAKYTFRARILYTTAATPDFKWRHVGPSSPSLVAIMRRYLEPGGVQQIAVDTAYSGADIAMTGGAGSGYVELEGTIHNGANAGPFEFHWAQNTSDGGNTSVLAGSYVEWMKA